MVLIIFNLILYMTENNYNEKYLKYKKKYLDLINQLGGAHTPEQIEFHNLLKSMDSNFFVSGFTGAYQWYNDDPDSKTPRSVTIIGEFHNNYELFGNCDVKTKVGEASHPRENMTVIELLHKLFKGTNNCMDFYLEDWITLFYDPETAMMNDFRPEYLNWTPADISPPINPTIPGEDYTEFTIKNLVKMTNTDIVPPPSGFGERKDVKKYPNVRLHTTEYRNAEREYIILPYSVSSNWLNFKLPNGGKDICRRLVNNEVHLNSLLRRLTKFMYLLSGLYPEPDADRNYDYLIKNINETESEFMLRSIYYDILFNSYRMGPGGYNFINSDRTPTIGNEEFADIIRVELETYTRFMKKNISNLRKFDTITLKKYIDFFVSYLNVYLHINNIKTNYPRLQFNNVRLYSLLQILTTTLVDIYSISRSLKIYSLKDQSRNLMNDSLCYNQFGINNRNLIFYHGYAHTAMYYIFWRHFFNRTSDLSIKRESMNREFTYDYNFIFNRPFTYSNNTYNLSDPVDYMIDLDKIITHKYIYDLYGIDIKFGANYSFPAISRLYFENNNTFNNELNITTYDDVQCLGNMNNVLKKMLINISKTHKERIIMYNQLTNKIDIPSSISSTLISIKKIIETNRNFIDGNNYNILLNTMFTTNTNIPLLGAIKEYMVMYNNNIYTAEEFKNHMLNNNFPINDTMYMDDKRELEGIATKFFTKYFLQDDISRVNFVNFIIKIYTDVLNFWSNLRGTNILTRHAVALGGIGGNIERLVEIIYKGGMPMKILFSQIKKQFTIKIENKLHELFQDKFSLSDNDFTIHITTPNPYVPGLPEGIKNARLRMYNEVYNEISMLNYIIVREILNVFNNITKQKLLFTFFQNDETIQRKLLKVLLNAINKKTIDNIINKQATGENYSFMNLQNRMFESVQAHDDVLYPPENYELIDETYTPFKGEKVIGMESNNNRSSFIIMDNIVPRPDDNVNVVQYYNVLETTPFVFPLELRLNGVDVKHLYRADEVLNYIGNKLYNNGPKGPFYSSYNTDVSIKDIKFNLSRIKYNFRLYGTDNMEHKYINIPGEVLDVSIANQLNDNYYMNVHDDHYHYDTYMIYNDKKQIAKYKSFSLQGFIYDLNTVIFTQEISDLAYEQRNIHYPYGIPWASDKMSKRIARVLFLTFIELYNSNKFNGNTNINTNTIQLLYKSIKRNIILRPNLNNRDIILRGYGIIRLLINNLTRYHNLQDPGNIILNSLNNDMILLGRSLRINIQNIIFTPNINDMVVFNKLEQISGLYVFLYYIVKMIVYYKIHNRGTPIGGYFDNTRFAHFLTEINTSIINIENILNMIIHTTDFKMGKTLNKIDLESF